MGSISAAGYAYIALAASAVATGVSAYESHQAGVATANANKRKAIAEGLQAQEKQINMRQNMLKALATQNASSLGAVGTGSNTGFGANTLRQLKEGQNDLLVTQANASGKISLLEAAASNARSQGDLGAIGDIAGGVAKYAGSAGAGD